MVIRLASGSVHAAPSEGKCSQTSPGDFQHAWPLTPHTHTTQNTPHTATHTHRHAATTTKGKHHLAAIGTQRLAASALQADAWCTPPACCRPLCSNMVST